MTDQYIIPDARKGFKKRVGRCYELATRFVLYNHGCSLVHGSIQGCNHPRIKHAWALTPDGKVYEPVANTFLHPQVHRAFFRAITDRVYGYTETLRRTHREGYYGAWDDPEMRLKYKLERISECAKFNRGRRKLPKDQSQKDCVRRRRKSSRVLADRRSSLSSSGERSDRHLRVANGATLGVRADSLETLSSDLRLG